MESKDTSPSLQESKIKSSDFLSSNTEGVKPKNIVSKQHDPLTNEDKKYYRTKEVKVEKIIIKLR